MAGKQQDGNKWRGEVTEVIAAPIDKVWPILSDFDGLHRLFPEIFASCATVEGEKNKAGSVRTITGPQPDGFIIEARERLISIDDVNHTTTYIVERINTGFTGVQATIKNESVENGLQTLVVWPFEADPSSAQTEEQFVQGIGGLLIAILGLVKKLVAE